MNPEVQQEINWKEEHSLYVQFMADMNADRRGGDPIPVKEEHEYPAFIMSKPDQIRREMMSDFRKGYATLLQENREKAREAIARYESAHA